LAIASIVVFVVAAGPFREQWGLNENEELVNPVLTVVLTIIIVGISGADLVTGLISVIKRKERSVLVFLGMLITFWWGLVGAVGEFLI
jgi:divalent metal cation (Fe/Co/Zn/Cd) transporter